MKKIVIRVFSILLIIGGIVFLVIGIYPIFEMKQQVKHSLEEWEIQKEHTTSHLVSKEEQIRDATIISTIKIAEFDQILPIRIGTTNQILTQGVGLDTQTPLIGEKGNSVLYGHREEIFWNLKDVEMGDELVFETLEDTLTYQVTDIKIVDPEDPIIYQETEKYLVTLVTCYPFIYMGDTPERYIVVAELVDKIK